MPTAPFGSVLEALLKQSPQGGRLSILADIVVNPQFYCCISGNTVGVNKNPVALLVIAPAQVCIGAAVNADFSRSWSPTSSLAGTAWTVHWGDGQTSNGFFGNPRVPANENVNHPLGGYVAAGMYQVTLDVADMLGATHHTSIYVTAIDCAPAPSPPPAPPMPEMDVGFAAYAGCGASGLWFTRDGGQSWVAVAPGVFGGVQILDIGIDWFTLFLSGLRLWVVTERGLRTSRDSGYSWSPRELPEISAGHTPPLPYAVATSKTQPGALYVLAQGYYAGGTRSMLFYSTTRGATWDYVVWNAENLTSVGRDGWSDLSGGTVLNINWFSIDSTSTLWAAGGFTAVPDRLVAYWNDPNWIALPNTGLATNPPNTYATSIDHRSDDIIYIGGTWGVGAPYTGRVYYWNAGGATWVQVGDTHGSSRKIKFNGSDVLYAVTDKSGADDSGLWRVTAPNWVRLGTCTGGAAAWNPVYALEFDDSGGVYIGGDFTDVNGVPVSNVAYYSAGGVWSAVGAWGSAVTALRWDSTNGVLYAGSIHGDIKRWNGGYWESLPGTFLSAEVKSLRIRWGYLYAFGETTGGFGQAQLYRLPLGGTTWEYLKLFTHGLNPVTAGDTAQTDGYTLIGGGNFTSPPENVVSYNPYDTGITILSEAYAQSIDTSMDGQYVFVTLLDESGNPFVMRVEADLSDYTDVYTNFAGTWAGVVCDWNAAARVWTFGDLGGVKVALTDDSGDNWTDQTDGGWAGNELVRPLLPSTYDPNNVWAVLNTALESWLTRDGSDNWAQVGTVNTAFAAQCGARGFWNDLVVLLGRLNAGAQHLQFSANLGYRWAERSTGITANAPITSIVIVRQFSG